MSQLYGQKIRILLDTIEKSRKPLDAGVGDSKSKNIALFMQVVISIVALVWGTLIILGIGETNTELKMAACGWVGMVLGYWFG
ncbi:hypothetical protein [Vibrio sp. St2]|uniref:hypothetical protein n=1 Tax=Vibrio sp. St2 TaxID=2853441 RepID=UPI00248ECF6E|nr:hypothetical protein [Vibrio sp. St2]